VPLDNTGSSFGGQAQARASYGSVDAAHQPVDSVSISAASCTDCLAVAAAWRMQRRRSDQRLLRT
jgi:protein gp37